MQSPDIMNSGSSGYIGDKQTHVIAYEESCSLFYSGKAAMLMTGTWLLTELNEMIPGFMILDRILG